MKLRTGDYIYQTQTSIDRQGQRWLTIRRRRVLAVADDRVAVTGFQELVVPLDEVVTDYAWQSMGGLMGMDSTLTLDQLAKYRTDFALTQGAA